MADDLFSLVVSIGEVPKETAPFLRQAVEISARNIKDQIRADYTGARQLPGAAGSISYDIHGGTGARSGGIEAEIGPELGGQGSFVGLVDEGSKNGPGKKRIVKALSDEMDGFEKGIGRAIDDGLKAAGL